MHRTNRNCLDINIMSIQSKRVRRSSPKQHCHAVNTKKKKKKFLYFFFWWVAFAPKGACFQTASLSIWSWQESEDSCHHFVQCICTICRISQSVLDFLFVWFVPNCGLFLREKLFTWHQWRCNNLRRRLVAPSLIQILFER